MSFLSTGGIGLLASLSSDAIMATVKENIPAMIESTTEGSTSENIGEKIKNELNHKELRDDIRQFQ